MIKFAQIGRQGFNIEMISEVFFLDKADEPRVHMFLAGEKDDYFLVFKGDDYDLFLAWWATVAMIIVADDEQAG